MPFSSHSADSDALRSRPDDLSLAVSQLAAADLDDPATIDARERILAFCGEHDDALYRTCLTGHLTGSALVVDSAGERTLLLHHAKLDRWLQPGGHADGDGNLAAVALREATEETGIDDLRLVTPGIDIDIHTIPERGDEPSQLHLDLRFLVLAPDDAVVAHNDESFSARWAPGDDPSIAEAPELSRAVGRALAVAGDLIGS
ncbi:MAG: NUDIX hydrolase [Acidimicrobiales bacterium]